MCTWAAALKLLAKYLLWSNPINTGFHTLEGKEKYFHVEPNEVQFLMVQSDVDSLVNKGVCVFFSMCCSRPVWY